MLTTAHCSRETTDAMMQAVAAVSRQEPDRRFRRRAWIGHDSRALSVRLAGRWSGSVARVDPLSSSPDDASGDRHPVRL